MRSPAGDTARRARERTRRQRRHGARLRRRNLLLQVFRKADARRRIERSRAALRGQAEKTREMVRSARRRAQRAAHHR